MRREFLIAATLLFAPLSARAEVLHTERSLYRNIVVYEDDALRCMRFGRTTTTRQSCVSRTQPEKLVFEYAKMTMGAFYMNPDPKRILIIGLGGGTLPTAFQRMFPNAKMDTVEIDPAIVRMAEAYFDFKPAPGTRVVTEDGRVFVKRMLKEGTKYDLVILDAFDHKYIPEHLLTREFLQQVKGVMSDKGVLAANTFSSSALFESETATYHNVFGDFYALTPGNRVILIRQGGLADAEELGRNAALMEEKFKSMGIGSEQLLPMFIKDQTTNSRAPILTDQYSPSNLLNAE